jgi:sialidase-1
MQSQNRMFFRGIVFTIICFTAMIGVCAAAQDFKAVKDTSEKVDVSDKIPYEIVLDLLPNEKNPRNSEGDFIVLKDGSLLFIYTHFYGGKDDNDAAFLASRRSIDGGKSWTSKDEVVVVNEGGMNVMSVSLLRLSDDSIALFYIRKNGEDDCRPLMRISHDEAQSWGDAVECIPEPIGYYVINNSRIVQLSGGRLVIPAALHARQGESFHERGISMCVLSDDLGKTWYFSQTTLEAPPEFNTGFQEPGVIELKNGHLLMWLRNSSGFFYRSISEDGGITWSDAVPTELATPVSPLSVKRIPGTDALLMLWNDHANIDEALRKKRTPFTLAISTDEGLTWHNRVNLEDNPHGWYCYTAIAFTDEHALFGFCAGDTQVVPGLSHTRIGRVPLSWLRERIAL